MDGNAFIVTNTGVELPAFERKTYLLAFPSRKLLENETVKSAIVKLKSVAHASEAVMNFVEINPAKLKIGENEFTCMDAREFSMESRGQLRGKNFVTFAASAFFAHPEIAAKLRESGHANLTEAVAAILETMREEEISIDILSNHFGEDGGCGGLNFVKNNCGGLEIPTAEDYKKLFEKTRETINSKFGGIAKNAKLIIYQTDSNGEIYASFDLENTDEFKKFEEKYDGDF